jgi:ankyrin repeat protein
MDMKYNIFMHSISKLMKVNHIPVLEKNIVKCIYIIFLFCTSFMPCRVRPYLKISALLQHGADANIRNTEGKTALELADTATRPVLTGDYRKEELLEAARSGAEDRLLTLLNPLNVNCHASDGRRSTPLHLAAGYNRNRVVQLLLQHGADVHAKDKG